VKSYFFDLDGTLCDSRPGLVLSLRAAFDALDIESDEDLGIFLGAPLPTIFRAAMPGIDEIDIAYGIKKFRAAYEAAGIYHSPLYDGAATLLKELKTRGATVWLATLKPQAYAEEVLRNNSITLFFDGVAGAGRDEKDTKTQVVARALTQAGAAPENCLMLGDRAFDITGALDNGIRPVGALWGYGSREEMTEAGCNHFAASCAEFRATYVDET
jgi:phosphoglycolate phosphatase